MRFCKKCQSPMDGKWQIEFCSHICSSSFYAASIKPRQCPHCGIFLYRRWDYHISRCAEKITRKENWKKQQEAWAAAKRKTCKGCNSDFIANSSDQKFCSSQCYQINWSRLITPEIRLRLSIGTSKSMNKRYASGWEPVCGRSKKYDYYSKIAGAIKVDGTWELAFAQYLDTTGFVWSRNKNRFEYTNLNDRRSTYQPDFYIKTHDLYIEVKGYETDLDRCKWSQFPHSLRVIRKAEIMFIMDGKPIEWSDWIANPSAPSTGVGIRTSSVRAGVA